MTGKLLRLGCFPPQHKHFLTEKRLVSKDSYTAHTFVVLSHSRHLKDKPFTAATPSPFLIVQKQIAGQIKAEDGRVDCSLQPPKLEVC